jgi:hypothetical protein
MQAGSTGRVPDVFIDRDRAMDQSQELVGVNAEGAAITARDRDIESSQKFVHAGAQENLW